jgi:hypothetical protein
MTLRLKWGVVAGALAALAGTAFVYFHSQPIVIRAGGVDDVCGTRAAAAVDNLPLHRRPSRFSAVSAHLSRHQQVNVCLEIGRWSAVVVSEKSKDCRLPHDLQRGEVEYRGPCRSGWVESRLIRMIAG